MTQNQPELPNEAIDMSLGATSPSDAEEFEDYFSGFGGTKKFMLPDGVQYIEYQLMNEGQKAQFQRDTRSAINISRKTESASVMPDPSRERHALIKASVCDWNLVTRDRATGRKISVTFAPSNLDKWLKVANPKIIADLEAEIRKANPWMFEDVTVEDLDNQIEELQQMREEKLKLEGEKSSS